MAADIDSRENLIYDNNFLDNNGDGVQATDNGTDNRWNTSTGGNYWSDWMTPDDNGNGIVDEPYELDGDAGASDLLPLTDVPSNPIVRADAGSDITVNQHREVTFNGTGSWANAAIVNFTWSFEYGGIGVHLYGERPSFLFHDAGTYSVDLRVLDARGRNDTDNMTVNVLDTEAPVALAGPDTVINRGEAYRFNGSGSTDNTKITNLTWSFEYGGDEVRLYGTDASFIFVVPGIYNITGCCKNPNEK